jgi:histidinol-phosphate aminotransferase
MGVGAIKDNEYFERNCKVIIKTREWLKGELENIGFTLTESKTNFLFAKTEKIGGKDLYLKLKENGILIRHFDSERTRDYIRITIGSREDMEKFLLTVKDIIGGKI